MAKKNKKERKTLNSDTGAIFFLLGISLFFAFVANLSLFSVPFSLLINVVVISSAILMLSLGIIITIKNKLEHNYKVQSKPSEELRSSLEAAMQSAWQDHHHARDQTWKGLQMEALLAIALIGIDLQANGDSIKYIPLVGSSLLFLLAISGIMIALHHRELEIRKFRHIMHCEDALGLRPYIDGVKLPVPIYVWDLFAFWKSNTVLFIMRMHFTIMIFAVYFFISRF